MSVSVSVSVCLRVSMCVSNIVDYYYYYHLLDSVGPNIDITSSSVGMPTFLYIITLISFICFIHYIHFIYIVCFIYIDIKARGGLFAKMIS